MITLKRVSSALFLAAFALMFAAFPGRARALGGFQIDEFHAHLEVSPDARVRITETISVMFHEPRRGIYRIIPVDYAAKSGISQRIDFSLLDARDGDGARVTTQVSRGEGKVNIRFGDADRVFPAGTRLTYILTYEFDGLMNWVKGPDGKTVAQIYWNATGDEWEAVMMKSGFDAMFPLSPGDVRMSVYKGRRGETIHDDLASHVADAPGPNTDVRMTLSASTAAGALDLPLSPGEGITVIIDLPESSIPKPALASGLNFHRYVMPNLGFTIPFIVALIMFPLWFLRGRDMPVGPIAVRYQPPDDLTGAEAGTLLDARADNVDVVAGLVGLIIKGVFRLVSEEKGILITRQAPKLIRRRDKPPPVEGFGKFETLLLDTLAPAGDEIDAATMRAYLPGGMQAMRDCLYDGLVERGYYDKSPAAVRQFWVMMSLMLIAALAVFFRFLNPFGSWVPSIIGSALGLAAAIPAALAMPARTVKGTKAFRDLMGFREFMSRARGQELVFMTEKQPDMALFEKYLPHAVAFGLVDHWADAFKDILTAPPDWYSGPSGAAFNWGLFGPQFRSMSSGLETAAQPQSQSSGSGWSGGGGGFSGGGGGGGGGGSW